VVAEELAVAGDNEQLHLNPRADSKCQGVYFNAHINMWGVLAPGNAALGYYSEPRDAALAFSRCRATSENRPRHLPPPPPPCPRRRRSRHLHR